MMDIQILNSPLSIDQCYDFVQHTAAGGIAIFVGTVRDKTKGKEVEGLDFESYEVMAVSELKKIGLTMQQQWSTLAISVHHRTGSLKVGEKAVIIAVSTPHRKAAFEACQYAIDTLKETVPIWKKEIFVDGEVWVSAHP